MHTCAKHYNFDNVTRHDSILFHAAGKESRNKAMQCGRRTSRQRRCQDFCLGGGPPGTFDVISPEADHVRWGGGGSGRHFFR